MAFAVPEGLAPEMYPLAWLVGTWRGHGFLAYPEISERPFVQEVTFGHDGGPYLSYASTIWLLQESPAAEGDGELEDEAAELVAGTVWATESGYWRPAVRPGEASSRATTTDGEQETELEVLIADPSGHVSIYLGTARGPRVEIATDLVARTATAVEISAVHRMYGLVGGELMWALDMAAFGHELRPYASARLGRRAVAVRGGAT
jgi:hypothetical protein